MDREHWKAGLASAAGFFAGLLVLLAAWLALGRRAISSGSFDAPLSAALFLPLPPLFSWLAVRKLNRMGLVRCWFPGNVAAGTAVAFLFATPFAVTAAVAMVLRSGVYRDALFLGLAAGIAGPGMLLGGALAAIPEKSCVGRILLCGMLTAAFLLLAWVALT